MSIAIAYIKEGYTAQQKQLLIRETKKACMEGLGVTVNHSFVFIQEIPEENCDEQTKRMQSLFVYTTFGKTLEGKEKVCQGFEQACKTALGEDHGKSIVIFKEHSDENAGRAGHLRPFIPR